MMTSRFTHRVNGGKLNVMDRPRGIEFSAWLAMERRTTPDEVAFFLSSYQFTHSLAFRCRHHGQTSVSLRIHRPHRKDHIILRNLQRGAIDPPHPSAAFPL